MQYHYLTTNTWARELILVFVAGFVVATLLWFSLYFYQARPAQADALQAQEAEAQQVSARLQRCSAEQNRLEEERQRLESEVEQLDRQLRQSWSAYGRCKEKASQGH